jgi:hypothetical protein
VQRPELLEAPGRTLYRAYAVALVDWLSRTSDGSLHLAQFILRLPASSNDPLAELRSCFPELSGADYEKRWQEQIARLASHQPYQLLGSEETERRLQEMLHVEVSDRRSVRKYELKEFPTFTKNKSAKKSLSSLEYELEGLTTRSHPVYVAIVTEYAEITALLIRGKTLDVPHRLERLQNLRQAMAVQMRGIDDYLNWFEATRMLSRSGEFTDYLKAAERASRPERTKRDPISVYLDALETELDERDLTVR